MRKRNWPLIIWGVWTAFLAVAAVYIIFRAT